MDNSASAPDPSVHRAPGVLLSVALAPLGGIVTEMSMRWPVGAEWDAARVDAVGRPLPGAGERVLGRWVSGHRGDRAADCQVSGTWSTGNSIEQGTVAVGPLFLLLTEHRLRCAMPPGGTLVRRRGKGLEVLREGPYAFVLDLAELDRFDGGRHGVAVAGPVEGVVVPRALPVRADWIVPPDAAAGTSHLAAALLRALIDVKAGHPDEEHREVAARLAMADADWLVDDELFHVSF